MRALGRTAVASAVLAASCVCGCSSTPRPVFPPTLVGSWRGAQRSDLLEIAPGGVVVVEGQGMPIRVGRCLVDGNTLTIRYQLGSESCPEEPGSYTFTVDGGTLSLVELTETCVDRRLVLSQSFVRSPDR